MATPGIGAGDVLTACKFIYDICMKYKDAVEQYEEIAEKAGSINDLIVRLQAEAATPGSLVERSGAEKELNGHLAGLESDLQKLNKLVEKYAKIHDDGPGRRLLWAVWESGNLTEYRRKLGYHEQKLQIWCQALFFESLRRLETGHAEVIDALRDLSKAQEKVIKDGLKAKDLKPLYSALRRRGIPSSDIEPNLKLAQTYLHVDDRDKPVFTDQVRQKDPRYNSSVDPLRHGSYGPRPSYGHPPPPSPPSPMFYATPSREQDGYVYDFERVAKGSRDFNDESDGDQNKARTVFPGKKPSGNVRRSQSSRKPKDSRSFNIDELLRTECERKEARASNQGNSLQPEVPKTGHIRRKSETQLPSRSKSPLIIIKDDGPSGRVPTRDTEHRRTRSNSTNRRRTGDTNDVPVIVVEEHVPSRGRGERSGSRKRDESTSSYHRERPRSSSGGSERSVTKYRVVRAMDRIDSMPIDQDGK